jgi:hypothetical protein
MNDGIGASFVDLDPVFDSGGRIACLVGHGATKNTTAFSVIFVERVFRGTYSGA